VTHLRTLYGFGVRGALRRWPVVAALFVASVVCGIAFASLAWVSLATVLDASLATRTLLRDLDINVFVDLFVHHADSVRLFASAAVLLLGVSVCLWIWLNALAVVAVGEPGDWSTCTHRALDSYPTFLCLWGLATLVAGGTIMPIILAGRVLTRWTAESPSEMTAHWVLFGCIGATLVLLLVLTTIHDHARIHSVATGAGATAAYLWSVAFVIRSRLALPLTMSMLATTAAFWLLYQGVGRMIGTQSLIGIAASLAAGQLLMLARMFLRVGCFAAETELQNVSDVTAD
jgi:hypothetical protein